jgi:hypothetical protein
MSEREAVAPRHRKDERDDLADLEAQVARKRTQVEGPLNENERTILGSHADYHAQRPSDGIIRDSGSISGFRDALTGQGASLEAYEAQNTVTQTGTKEYWKKLEGINNGVEETNFANMGVMQLAKEQAKAEALGDIAGVNEVRGVFDQYMLEQATSEGSGITDADLDKESARYDALVKKFVSNEIIDAEDPAVQDVENLVVPGADDEEDAPKAEDVPSADAETTQAPAEAAKEASTETEKTRHNATAELNGQTVTITKKFMGDDGEIVYKVEKADGSTDLVSAQELVLPAAIEKEPLGDRLKKWWGKAKEIVEEKLTFEYLGAMWTNLQNETINRGVDPFESFDEQERKRKRNRTVIILGGAGLLVASYILNNHDQIAHTLFSGGDVAGALPTPGASGGNGLSPHDQSVAEALSGRNHTADALQQVPSSNRIDAQEAAAAAPPPAVEAPSAADMAAFNVGNGEGGLELFNNLNIDPAKWAGNANDLLAKFPQDFYQMASGGVGIAHQGLLSPEARNAIEALR